MADAFQPPSEFDDYVIVEPLGSGAMGSVFLAEDTILARQVAVKFVSAVHPDPAARQRFLIEARAAARIQHPNVASIYRVGELGDRPYLVTELVRGRSLADLTKPVSAERAIEIGVDVARGLAAAHRRGVVHRDLKPENVMITEEGSAKLVDFGMAALVADGEEPAPGAVGTPDFMAPEVWAGTGSTRRTDVYALGGVLYELCTGRPPFADVPPREIPHVVQHRDAPRLEGVDARFADLVARCLARDPAVRFASGDELREALERLGRGGALPLPSGNPYRGLRPFDDAHQAVFFGRGGEIQEICDRLREGGVVLVTGDSGVGKSSVCRAGVLPAVAAGAMRDRRTWTPLTVIPGRHPLASLAAALGDDSLAASTRATPAGLARALRRHAGTTGGIVVFFDQLEELVTIADPEEAAALALALGPLASGIPGVRVLGTVRADLLSRLAALPGLGAELSRLLYFLRPLPPERLREVIEEPAQAAGARFETSEMVETLAEATAQAPQGGLPLLSFALAELWEARDKGRGVIPAAALAAMGGVSGALARHADGVIAALPTADRKRARHVLVRLVTAGGTRARASLAELGDGARPVLDALLGGRLLITEDGEHGPSYELAHEVLVQGWGTLRGWLEEDAHGRALRERITAAAAEWQELGRSADAVWSGRRLVEAGALDPGQLAERERSFLAASHRAERRRRFLGWGAAAALVLLVAGVIAGTRLLSQRRVDREVDALRREALAELGGARVALDTADRQANEAFVRFDTFLRADAETHWERVLAERLRAERLLGHAASNLESALAKDADRDDVRGLLAGTLYERALLAEIERRLSARDELFERVRVYDRDGTWLERLQAPAQVHVVTPVPAEVTLSPGARPLGTTPVDIALEPGSWVLVVSAPGRAEVRVPVWARRGAREELEIALPPADRVLPGFVYVPAGRFRFGSAGDEEGRRGFFDTVPAHDRWTDGYLIAREEVTYGEWLAWMDALPEAVRAQRLPHGDTKMSGVGTLAVTGGPRAWTLSMQPVDRPYRAAWGERVDYHERSRNVSQDWRAFPVTGVSAEDAQVYAAWLSINGRVPGARLCSELEWERAARGADERIYPHGDTLAADDANFDVTYGRDLLGPDEVGLHPRGRSPFGIDDMSGNAFEWTTSVLAPRGWVGRGGSYFHDRKTTQIINRAPSNASVHDQTVGFRLCASIEF